MGRKTFKRLPVEKRVIKTPMGNWVVKGPGGHRAKMDINLPRVLRDFMARTEEEQRAFTCVTWCDSCNFSDLGMIEPYEYKLGDKIYLEGKCTRCGSAVISEIIPKAEAGGDVDIIYPIQDASKPAHTYLPRGFSPSPFNRGYTDYDYPNRQSGGPVALPVKMALWLIALAMIIFMIYNITHAMTS